MALLFVEGFDGINTTTGTASNASTEAYLESRYGVQVWSGTNNPLVMNGWENGQALVFGIDSSADLNLIEFALEDTPQTVVVGFNIFPMRYTGKIETSFLSFKDIITNVTHVDLFMMQNQHIQVRRASTPLDSATNCLQPMVWNYVEVKVTISNTVGVVEIRVNGEERLALSGIDTKTGSGGDSLDTIRFTGLEGISVTAGEHFRLDDVYILDTSGGAPNNDYLGPVVVESLFPDGAGADTDWTPSAGSNFQNVDEVTFDSDTTYNSAATATNLDLFTTDDLAMIAGTVYGVAIDNLARVTEAGEKTLICKVKSSITEGTGSNAPLVNTSVYDMVSHLFEQDPNAAAAWTPTTVNAMQIGYEVG